MTIWATLLATSIAVPQSSPVKEPFHWTAYLRSGVTVHVAPSQSTGGLGGGAGVRMSFAKPWFVQADFNYLTLVGHVGELRLAGGIQRPGLWNPAVLFNGSVLLGQRLSFRTAEHPWPTSAPIVTGGIVVAPLRFTQQNRTVSVLELGIGVKPDFPGVGVTYSLGLLEVGHLF